MSPEKQRITIAEACPEIAEIDKDNGGVFWKKPDPFVQFDPLNDLNAMHEAENTLGTAAMVIYACELKDITKARNDIELIKANATQRAEAFLRTIGKWEEK